MVCSFGIEIEVTSCDTHRIKYNRTRETPVTLVVHSAVGLILTFDYVGDSVVRCCVYLALWGHRGEGVCVVWRVKGERRKKKGGGGRFIGPMRQ